MNSALVPPFIRRTKSIEAAILWLYLRGISSGNMGEALEVLVGKNALGFSSSNVSRLKQEWFEEYKKWQQKDLSKSDWVWLASLALWILFQVFSSLYI